MLAFSPFADSVWRLNPPLVCNQILETPGCQRAETTNYGKLAYLELANYGTIAVPMEKFCFYIGSNLCHHDVKQRRLSPSFDIIVLNTPESIEAPKDDRQPFIYFQRYVRKPKPPQSGLFGFLGSITTLRTFCQK